MSITIQWKRDKLEESEWIYLLSLEEKQQQKKSNRNITSSVVFLEGIGIIFQISKNRIIYHHQDQPYKSWK